MSKPSNIIGKGGLKMFTRKKMIFVTILLLFALMVAACEPEGQPADTTPAPEDTPVADNGEGIPATGEEDVPTITPETDSEIEATPDTALTPDTEESEVDTTPQDGTEYRDYGRVPITAGEGLPMSTTQFATATARSEMMQISNWMDFEVTDTAGNWIGSVHDYVLNTCEAHIIYVAIQTSDNGDLILMPYEVVTLGGGFLDPEARVIAIPIAASEIENAPTVAADTDITDVNWETESRSFWSNYLNLSNLTTVCLIGDNVVLIDYASNILGARIQDGNGQPLGTIEDVTLYPETGLLRFVVISLDEGGYRFAPMGAINIETQETDGETVFVLLVEREILMSSPAYDSIPDTTQDNWEGEPLEYWSQHVPMTREAQQQE
jgi:sporulation protein YlmC with PRC-barrel domain